MSKRKPRLTKKQRKAQSPFTREPRPGEFVLQDDDGSEQVVTLDTPVTRAMVGAGPDEPFESVLPRLEAALEASLEDDLPQRFDSPRLRELVGATKNDPWKRVRGMVMVHAEENDVSVESIIQRSIAAPN
jgi:hypothetical protein